MKKPLIVGNWKLYVTDIDEAIANAQKLTRGAVKTGSVIVLCPPVPFIDAVTKILKRRKLATGAQRASLSGDEKRTGEYTAEMISSLGAEYVIVGHSERRAMGESDEHVHSLLMNVLDADLTPILCVGEQTRSASSGDHFGFIENQLRAALTGVNPKDVRGIVVAYEPIWAIGKGPGEAMTPADLEETALYIRKILVDIFGRARALAVPVLYGGSVEASNAAELMKSGVAGFLVGHASVDPVSLLSIAKASASHATSKH